MAGFIGLVAALAYVQPFIFQTNQLPDLNQPEVITVFGGINSAKLDSTSSDFQVSDKLKARYLHSGLPLHVARQFAEQLQQLMHREKLYHNYELRLDTLAERLNLSRHHLSQVLNEQLGMNFFEYINSLRVEEAKNLLSQTSSTQLTIIQIAYQVGFNNKVSFNKSFKHITGFTPRDFRQKILDDVNQNSRESLKKI